MSVVLLNFVTQPQTGPNISIISATSLAQSNSHSTN